MDRREFLRYNALGFLSISVACAMPHSHDMHDMHEHHAMMQDSKIDTSFITLQENIALFDPKKFPNNENLKPLSLLHSQTNKTKTFSATIEIKEQELELVKGKKTKCYTYNGLVPGPKIEVYEGDEVIINVKNSLNEATTIHWHGVPVPPSQDGNPHDPILPNTQRTYHFTIPQGSAGTYWYHPHPHYTTGKQVAMGLAGAFVIKAKNDVLSHLKEQDWFISDLGLDNNAQIRANTLGDWLNGREGHLVLINGQLQPKISIDERQRIRIYNCCSARYLKLRAQGVKFVIIGTDGGLIEKPITQQEIFLAPSSRIEVVLQSSKLSDIKLESIYYDRDKMMIQDSKENLLLATLQIKQRPPTLPSVLRTFDTKKPKAFKQVVMSEDHMQMHGMSKKTQEEIKQSLANMFLLNGKVYDMNRIDLTSRVGEVEEWSIVNKSHMDHPFHIHGAQFEVISTTLKGKTTLPQFRAFYDTINLKPNQEIKIRIAQNFEGLRMFHCHILEHEDLGMMGNLMVTKT